MIDNTRAHVIKRDFPILGLSRDGKPLTYLDNGASSQKPQSVIDRLVRYYSSGNANIHRGVYDLSEKATAEYDNARALVASLINAPEPAEVIFTRGTTDSLNLLASSLPALLDPARTDIVITEMEHHANLIPWQQLALKQGKTLRFMPVVMSGDYAYTLDYSAAEQLIGSHTAVVSFPHVSNVLGTVVDAARLVRLARNAGAISIIDGAQSVPHMPVDVQALGCDFLVFSSHKMVGPTGVGVLYGRRELLEKLPPYQFGGDMIRSVSYETAEWAEIPSKFEAGTPNIAGVIGLGAAVGYLQSVGLAEIDGWERQLHAAAWEQLSLVDRVTLLNPGKGQSAGILSFTVRGAHPHDIASLLNDANIAVRAGHHCAMPLIQKLGVPATVRASFYLYNTLEDVERLVGEVGKIKEMFE